MLPEYNVLEYFSQWRVRKPLFSTGLVDCPERASSRNFRTFKRALALRSSPCSRMSAINCAVTSSMRIFLFCTAGVDCAEDKPFMV